MTVRALDRMASNRVGISKQLRSRQQFARARATPIAYHGGAADHHDFIDSHRAFVTLLVRFRFDPASNRAVVARVCRRFIHSFIRLIDLRRVAPVGVVTNSPTMMILYIVLKKI